jgi:hypothetical protein
MFIQRQLQNTIHSLKGSNSLSQGNALGKMRGVSQPCKGEIPLSEG